MHGRRLHGGQRARARAALRAHGGQAARPRHGARPRPSLLERRGRRRVTRLSILHDADGVVVVDKPPGLEATGRTPDDPGGVQHHLAVQLRRPVWAVHQLDRDTSGVLIFVRKRSLVARWQEALARGDKRYVALVHGREGHGSEAFEPRTIDAPVAYDRGARRWVVREGGKPARSTVEVVSVGADAMRVHVTLHTGRTHQARVHLAHVGHPLVGERRYRTPPCELHPRHALHAARVAALGAVFEAPLPEDLRALARRLGLDEE
ncbi:MAG: RluA family pseudouridine synthase [Sandaracinaceae bacterium]|nr:MAG: RluA family pseudouridine synthase [Sandaracinaceae bacterium]